MPEPITEVWVWVTSHPSGRVAGASLNGPGSSIHDMLARGATRETITASEGLFAAWMQDKTLHRYEWNGYTLQRLPLATPEIVADKERLDWLERDHNARVWPALRIQSGEKGVFGVRVEHEGGKGFSPNGKLREAIDDARAAGGAHGA